MQNPDFEYLYTISDRIPPYTYKKYPEVGKTLNWWIENRRTNNQDLLYLGTSNARGLVSPRTVVSSAGFPFNVHVLSIPGGGFVETRKALHLLPTLPKVKAVVIALGSNEISDKFGRRKPYEFVSDGIAHLMTDIWEIYPTAEIFALGILPIPSRAITPERALHVSTNYLEPAVRGKGGVFLKAPPLLSDDFGKDNVHLNAHGLLKLWKYVESKVPGRLPSRRHKRISFRFLKRTTSSEQKEMIDFLHERYHVDFAAFRNARFGVASFKSSNLFWLRRLLGKSWENGFVETPGGLRFTARMRYHL